MQCKEKPDRKTQPLRESYSDTLPPAVWEEIEDDLEMTCSFGPHVLMVRETVWILLGYTAKFFLMAVIRTAKKQT